MRRKHIFLSLLAVVLVLGLSVGRAWSYFTDTTTVEGGLNLSVQPDTTITEEYEPKTHTKKVTITNNSSMVPVYVRARAYVPSILKGKASGTKWTGTDNGLSADDTNQWFVYSDVLAPGASAEQFNVSFSLPGGFDPKDNPTGAQEGDELNIVVQYECLPVSYDASGNALPANWN